MRTKTLFILSIALVVTSAHVVAEVVVADNKTVATGATTNKSAQDRVPNQKEPIEVFLLHPGDRFLNESSMELAIGVENNITVLYFTNLTYDLENDKVGPIKTLTRLSLLNDTLLRSTLDYGMNCIPVYLDGLGACLSKVVLPNGTTTFDFNLLNTTTGEVWTVYADTRDAFAISYIDIIKNGSIVYTLYASGLKGGVKIAAFDISDPTQMFKNFTLNIPEQSLGITGYAMRLISSNDSCLLTLVYLSRGGIFKIEIDASSAKWSEPTLLYAGIWGGSNFWAVSDHSKNYYTVHRAYSADMYGYYSLWSSKSNKRIYMNNREVYTLHHELQEVFVNSAEECMIVWSDYNNNNLCFVEIYDHDMVLKTTIRKQDCGYNGIKIFEDQGHAYGVARDARSVMSYTVQRNARLLSLY